MSADAARHILEEAYHDLLAQWQRTQASWNDEKSFEFEKEYLSPLRTDVSLAMDAAGELSRLIDRAREECA